MNNINGVVPLETKPQWWSFRPESIVPSLAAVQKIMGVPRRLRHQQTSKQSYSKALNPTDQNTPEAPEESKWQSVKDTCINLLNGNGALLQVQNRQRTADILFTESKDSLLYDRFLKADKAFLFLATIGSAIEERAEILMAEGKYLEATMVDAVGSAAVELVVDSLQTKVADLTSKKCVRFSPGYGDWKLTVQKDFVQIFNGERYNISLNDSFMFTPHKTVSGVITSLTDKE